MPEFSPFEQLLIKRLDGLDERVDSVDEKVVLLRIDVAQLKVKAGIWGAAAGMIPALVTGFVAFASGAS